MSDVIPKSLDVWFGGPALDQVESEIEFGDGESPPFMVRAFEWTERFDQPFRASVDIVSEDLDTDLDALLGQPAVLTIVRPGRTIRHARGVVTRVRYLATRHRLLFARVRVESVLGLLRNSSRRRVFADQRLPEVLKAVTSDLFETHGGAWDFRAVSSPLPPRDYCVQYDESDLDFVLRLLAEHGLCLQSIDSDDHEVLRIIDTVAAASPLGTFPTIPHTEELASTSSLQYLSTGVDVRSQRVHARARDWKAQAGATFDTLLEHGGEPSRWGHVELHHPARLDEGTRGEDEHRDDTQRWVTRRSHEIEADAVAVSGESNAVDFAPGCVFDAVDHPHRDVDGRYVLAHVLHRGDFPEVEPNAATSRKTYRNRFVCQPGHLPICPPTRPRPRVLGPQTATVIGPPGEEIYTDRWGRVRVRFAWADDETAQTCWLRVAQSWAGAGFGATFVPRVGMEVVVSFLDGNPDRPLVTGCVYTGTNVPPLELPEHKTRTTLKTRSTPGGDGHNELRFEDAAGLEEVYLHAQRNQRTIVRSTQSTRVGRDSIRTVGGNQTVRIGHGDTDAPGNLEVSVSGNEDRTVDEAYTLVAKSTDSTAETTAKHTARDSVTLHCTPPTTAVSAAAPQGTTMELLPSSASLRADESIVLEAAQSIMLKVGDARLELTPRGVFLNGSVISADVDETLWLTSEAARIQLSPQSLTLYGGAKSESVVKVNERAIEARAAGTVFAKGEMVMFDGTLSAELRAKETKIVGFEDVSVHSVRGPMSITTPKTLRIDGEPIKLNCS